MTKKQKAQENQKRRNFWEVCPVTRVVPNKKAYNRKRDKISRYC